MISLEQLEACLRPVGDQECALNITVKPGQRKEGIVLDSAGQIVVKVNAPAQEGRANERLIEIIAEALGCPKRNISVARGQTSRHKELRIREYRLTKGR
jgi:uncharacterized protein (TIGR00251 family)